MWPSMLCRTALGAMAPLTTFAEVFLELHNLQVAKDSLRVLKAACLFVFATDKNI